MKGAKLQNLISAARGEKQVDLLLTNTRMINVFSGEIVSEKIAVAAGYIVGFGDYPAKETVDLGGRYVAPGFIDSHVHIESAMASVTEFAWAVLPFGTTTVVADPHEIANVLGIEGIRYMLRSSGQQPLNVYFALPSCVPATDLETSGATLTADDLQPFLNEERVVALAEMMNFPGVIYADPEVLRKIDIARIHRKPIDGHSPGLTGFELNAYISAGVASDHECTTAAEAREKLRAGMRIMIREGTGAKNLHDLLPIVNERTAPRIMWCTDDRHPHDLLDQGHIDSMVRTAIKQGLDPLLAVQMATINAAEYFGVNDIGAIAPGRRADLVVISDLDALTIDEVYSHGRRVAEDGNILSAIKKPRPIPVPASMHLQTETLDFSIPAGKTRARIIELVPHQIITRQRIMDVLVTGGSAVSDISRDILKIAVVERHRNSGNIGKGFAHGFGLRRGALASSVAHDSHNIIVVGSNDADMKAAVDAVAKMGGGLVAVCDQKICASLSLPIAGLMSPEPVQAVRDQLDILNEVSHELGVKQADPFMILSFLALPVIPELKVTDKGLVDVNQFKVVPLFVD
ncbi:adenine deaminase [Thermodesulfobacteriota bacterium]